ncbi:4'-phosphopantetheinyl transferase superfamily protein [Psychrobium sp. 1_MG-2023]|uniref:4'-phosphopantetheinyl transferase family protein n=1 Tax=Psychrobium sp. 1_MG-2023 TaxID=3062624 RepID=UPI000C34F65B|nr:4'-phosphopantetheinyl transferase superfamily protein [Psychrobium sp. 1_MG-2023]MDP2562722.1 4'-phosphopantetheinyl transferase superfamily protein [Psychrobium sp. 1_MG-2023]PKF54016.1 4-phosphopantetheinyl transferase [Alteromonadales bacterium alter-6D02]
MALLENQVDIWLVKPHHISCPNQLAYFRQQLSEQERAKVDKQYNQEGRHSALVTRALVRNVLSKYHSTIAPSDWRFGKGFNGKPFISNPNVTLDFNLSHAQGLIAIAVSHQLELGIDVEYIKRKANTYKLAPRYFSPYENEALAQLPYQQQAIDFFNFWTLKESYIKACGDGLAIPLDHFWFKIKSFDDIELGFSELRNDSPTQWQSFLFEPTLEHKMALTVRANRTAPLTINQFNFIEDNLITQL